MRIKTAILIMLMLPIVMKSQNATATLGNMISCAGENVLVPMDVTNFIDVGSMTFFIGYDTNAAEFLSLQNINPAIPAPINFFASNGQVAIAYSHTVGFNIASGKIFDLSFTFLGDSTLLPFNPGTEIANIDLQEIPLDTYPGSIKSSLLITGNPENVTSYPDSDVTFGVTSPGNPDYQWQENSGTGWNDLQNNSTYSGANTDTLTINDVPLSFNGYYYRCKLSDNECNETSDSALLTVIPTYPVASLGIISSCPGNTVLEPLVVSEFLDVIEFTFNISFNTDYLVFKGFENIHADLLPGELISSPLTDPPGVVIHYVIASPVNITSGKLFDLKFDYGSQDHLLLFETGSVVLNSLSNPIDIAFSNGAIYQYAVPQVISQPEDITVSEFEDAFFQVEAVNTDEYHWQISTDGGESWNILTNIPPYFNVNTSLLTISPATADMDGHQFDCRLDNENCTIYSSAATLFVDTLTYTGNLDKEIQLIVHPVPFRDRIYLSLPANYSCNIIQVYNIQGMLLYSFNINQTRGQQELNLDLSALPEGLFFLRITGMRDGKPAIEQKKILKTN
jgi:hypothetical protein